MVGTFWAFVPAIIAILLALITKQVYLSLFVGIFTGAMFLECGNPIGALQAIFEKMAGQLGTYGGILIFLVVLGIFSVLMVKTGGSKAYGEWASKKIKTPEGAQLATVGLGCLIFVDDYFNCLTVGSAMRPVTDKYKISRAKLAYLIDSTAAPICIIAPISSWAAAVSGYADGGILAFIKSIPFNMYALLTIAFMIVTIVLRLDFFKMKRNQLAAQNGDLFAGETELPTEEVASSGRKGKVLYMIIPVVVLIVCCVGAMIYNGWSWLHTLSAAELQDEIGKSTFNVLDMFAQCDSSIALATGSCIALIITFVYYICSKALSFKECMSSIAEGFKSMVPAILILVFAWTLCAFMGAKGQEGSLNARGFVQSTISADTMALGVIPFVFFILACLISFATGTSWGTFGTLIPIATAVMSATSSEGLFYLTMSAVLAGAVYGDHVSPISDTTIMASSGAQCNHLDHVKTQMPYATIIAIVSGLTYLIVGFSATTKLGQSYGATAGLTIAIGVLLLGSALVAAYFLNKSGVLENLSGKIFKKQQVAATTAPTTETEAAQEINAAEEAKTTEEANVDSEVNGADEVKEDK